VSLELQRDHLQLDLEHLKERECEELVPPKLLSMIVTSNLVMQNLRPRHPNLIQRFTRIGCRIRHRA
jgi:hypothetical protein